MRHGWLRYRTPLFLREKLSQENCVDADFTVIVPFLGLLDNFAEIAAKDEVGIQLQNAKLLGG